MADDLRDSGEENEVDAGSFSGTGLETEAQIQSKLSDDATKELDGGDKTFGSCAVMGNESGCSDVVPNCVPFKQSNCTETVVAEDEQNALLSEEHLLQDPVEKIGTEILEILPEDSISPVFIQPNEQSNDEISVSETDKVEPRNEPAGPMEADDQIQVQPVLPAANVTDKEASTCEVDGSNNTETAFSETDEIETLNGSAEPIKAEDQMQVESVLPLENELKACEVGGSNDIEMEDDFANVEEPSSDKELSACEELDSEGTLLSDNALCSTSEPNPETSSLVDEEALPGLVHQENFIMLDVPLVPSPVKGLVVDVAHEKSILETKEARTVSQHNGFSETADYCDVVAVDDKTAGVGNCENATREPGAIDGLDADGVDCDNMSEESKITEDLETNENISEVATKESATEDSKGDVDLESGQDLSDFTESVDCIEPDAGDNNNGCGGKFVDDGRTESVDQFSKLDADISKMSDASNDTIHMNDDAPGRNPRSDESLDVGISKNSDDTFKIDCPLTYTPDEKSNEAEVDAGDTKDGDDKRVAKLDNVATEEILSKSSVNENEVEADLKKELDKKSITNDKTKTVAGAVNAHASDTGIKSSTNNRTQQKTGKNGQTGKNAQTSKGTRQQECIVCKKVTKCKYNIVRNGDTKHLCDDKCFQLFRNKPTTYLQAGGKKPEADDAESCPQCQKPVPAKTRGRNSLKIDKTIKKFCSAACLNIFKKTRKSCANCGKDLRNDANAVAVPVEGEGSKDFCCHACLVKYEHSKEKQTTKIEDDDDDVEIVERTPAHKIKTTSVRHLNAGKSKCSVCSKLTIVRQEANFKGVTYKLCGDACLSAFRTMHNLSVSHCDDCFGMYGLDDMHVQTIQFEGLSKTFCSSRCLSNFKTTKRRVVPCTWCTTRKSNFDMVERLDANGKFQMFCSLNCLSLYRVNLQANSNQSVACDQCHNCIPALYHLTMSDASVRNFCGYNCVMAFQAQFSQPSTTSGELPIPGDRVTANAANTQPAQSAVPPSQPARNSPYGTRNSSRAAKSTSSPTLISQMQSSTMPVISNIVSLATVSSASPVSHLADNANASMKQSAHIGVQTVAAHEIIVQPPPPKQVKNKALLCKPFMQTKATSCRPHTVMKGSQTEENWEPKKVIVPFPVPTATPAPMMMYSNPVPYPVLLPIPIPIPIFIPTTKKSTAGIMKKIKELQERVPSDPFEAELLMMAEAVANANRAASSDSESDDDDDADGGEFVSVRNVSGVHVAAADNPANLGAQTRGTNGELAEDMLQMALRMAEMQSEQTLDLEDAVDPTPLRSRESVSQTSVPVFDTISANADILHASHAMSTPRGRGRGKRRGGSRGGRGSSSAKKPRFDEVQAESAPASAIVPPVVTEPPADANCILKFTYGVNAYKHWAIQKNAHLERVVPPKAGTRQRLYKLDVLQCSADELNYALCLFVKEVRKPNGEEYAPDSIFYLCLGIQQYLYENGRIDNIFTDFFYEKFTDCLNEILGHYEVRLNAQGMLVCRIEEEHLWEAKQLGAHSPHVLLNTLIYFNTRHFMLCTPEDHLGLSFSHIMKHWKKTSTPSGKPGRSVYLRYYATSQLGGDASQKRKKEELPVFEQAENVDNPLRCPVKLYEFYLSKCPESIKNRSDVFYLVPERSCVPDSPVWYSTVSLGLDGMTRMLNRLRVVREIQESQLTSLAVPYYS